MGDASDYADVQRFLRSTEGQGRLEGLRKKLQYQCIEDIGFTNSAHGVGIILTLGSGESIDLQELLDGLGVAKLRRLYGYVLTREYLVDFPERKA